MKTRREEFAWARFAQADIPYENVRVTAGRRVLVFDWKGIWPRDRHISRAESVHRAFCLAALEQMIGLAGWRWLRRAGRHSPGFARHSRACERPRERACPAWFPRCPTTRNYADTALRENVSLSTLRGVVLLQEKFTRDKKFALFTYIYPELRKIITLDAYLMYSEEWKKVRDDKLKKITQSRNICNAVK